MVYVFDYKDYREFLKDIVEYKRASDSKYSYIYYSRLINASEPYLKQVISGRRKISLEKAKLLSKKIKLTSLESSYFLTMVMKDDSKTEELKSYFTNLLDNLRDLKPLNYSNKKRFRCIFSDTLSWEIYTLLGLSKVKFDAKEIKSLLKGKYTLTEIKESMKYLEITESIIINHDKSVVTRDVILENDEDIRPIYKNALGRSIQYLEDSQLDKEIDYFDSFCLILDDDDFPKLRKVLHQAKSNIAKISMNSKNKNRVAFYNTNLFFTSKKK